MEMATLSWASIDINKRKSKKSKNWMFDDESKKELRKVDNDIYDLRHCYDKLLAKQYPNVSTPTKRFVA